MGELDNLLQKLMAVLLISVAECTSDSLLVVCENIGRIGEIGDELYESHHVADLLGCQAIKVINHDDESAIEATKHRRHFLTLLLGGYFRLLLLSAAEGTGRDREGSGQPRNTNKSANRCEYLSVFADLCRHLAKFPRTAELGLNLTQKPQHKLLRTGEQPRIEPHDVAGFAFTDASGDQFQQRCLAAAPWAGYSHHEAVSKLSSRLRSEYLSEWHPVQQVFGWGHNRSIRIDGRRRARLGYQRLRLGYTRLSLLPSRAAEPHRKQLVDVRRFACA